MNDAVGTRYYIDPKTATIVERYSSRQWVSRWLYHGLHSLDLPWLYNYRPLWDIVVITLMLGGTAICVTSLMLAWRVFASNSRWCGARCVHPTKTWRSTSSVSRQELHAGRITSRVAPSRVAQRFAVGQAFQKRDEVAALLLRQRQRAQRGRAVGIRRASARLVVIEHGVQRGDAPVVHVGRGHGDVPQGRNAELAHVLEDLCMFGTARCCRQGT